MEGSQLSESQTKQIFDSGTFFPDGSKPIKTDDILETLNHFKAFDYILVHVNESLTHDFVKHLHRLLKQNTSQEGSELFSTGEYKRFNNQIGSLNAAQTTSVEDVEKEMTTYFKKYKDIKDEGKSIAKFHYDFEKIHPFSDGNGRIGRLLLYKELLRIDGIPLVVRDENRAYYIRGLQEYETNQGYLIDTLLNEQDYYRELIERFN
nr:Fic family protein [Enterococcus sp. BWB1-3]